LQYVILALMVAAALLRPKMLGREVGYASIGICGVLTSVATGGVPVGLVIDTAVSMGPAIATIASLMLFVGACRSVGLLDRITTLILKSAQGDSRRLMSLLFWIGAGFGALFTNDAAILLLTPLTIQLCLNRKGQHSDEDHLPFRFFTSAIWLARW
jgi:Na+/H+ antiporter NhaD/arsenite permease-like protein